MKIGQIRSMGPLNFTKYAEPWLPCLMEIEDLVYFDASINGVMHVAF